MTSPRAENRRYREMERDLGYTGRIRETPTPPDPLTEYVVVDLEDDLIDGTIITLGATMTAEEQAAEMYRQLVASGVDAIEAAWEVAERYGLVKKGEGDE